MKKEEVLAQDGKEGRPANIIFKDIIYDVSESRMWKEGVHMNRHKAGQDLTDFMALAPHGEEVLDRVAKVGKLEKEIEDSEFELKQKLRTLYQKLHPHPVLIHYPMGLLPFSCFMQVLFLITGQTSFEKTAYYALVCAVIAAIPAFFAGLFSWWLNYEMVKTALFKKKLYFSILFILFAGVAAILRLLVPAISFDYSSLTYIYNGLIILSIPTILFVAYNGGKITWPS